MTLTKTCQLQVIFYALLLIAPACLIGQTPAGDITRDQAIQFAHAAEQSPLGPNASQQRTQAMKFFENDHTSHVLLCQSIFHELVTNKKGHAQDISLQMLISASAFLAEHPESANDSTKQNMAGIDAALNVYDKFLATDPNSRSSYFDGLLRKRGEGKLEEAVQKSCK
jgi:hypothetical protein